MLRCIKISHGEKDVFAMRNIVHIVLFLLV